MNSHDQRGAIGFAEKILELLDEGRYTATYKFAVLLALIDLCLERTQASGVPPDTLTTRQLAEKVVQLYWSHTVPFAGRAPASILRQNVTGQAEIVSLIRRFRERYAADPSLPHWASRATALQQYERLICDVEWKLIEMPLPRLQTMGQSNRRFIYEINWDQRIEQPVVRAHFAGGTGTFDNRLLLLPGVGEYFVQLNALLRPLIQRRWAGLVSQVNRLPESELETFLFGANRIATARVRAGLWEAQDRRCFYCDRRLASPEQGEVDHFVPWSRYPDNALDNFVVADKACNAHKSNSLAASEHLVRWKQRLLAGSPDHVHLGDLAAATAWDRDAGRSASVARAIYFRLPTDAQLWLRGKEFVAPDATIIREALTV